MENLTQVGSITGIVLEHLATKGGRYEVLLVETHDGFGSTGYYDLVFKTRGRITGQNCNYPNKDAVYAGLAKKVNMARCVDGINYRPIKADS